MLAKLETPSMDCVLDFISGMLSYVHPAQIFWFAHRDFPGKGNSLDYWHYEKCDTWDYSKVVKNSSSQLIDFNLKIVFKLY